MLSKHRFLNAFIRNKYAKLAVARLTASNDKNLLACSVLPNQSPFLWPTERFVNTYSRRFYSDSKEVCTLPTTKYFSIRLNCAR